MQAAYTATNAETFLEVCDIRMNKLTVIPHIHRPTERGMKKRSMMMKTEMAAHSGVYHQRWVGGEWDELAEPVFGEEKGGYTLVNFFRFMQKYALPLLLAIAVALIIKNVDPDWYVNFEASHGGGDHATADSNETAHRMLRRSGDTDANHTDTDEVASPPVLFNLELNGHPITLHFIANDILMNFHFAIATEEIVESFLPGAILYPPTKVCHPSGTITLASAFVLPCDRGISIQSGYSILGIWHCAKRPAITLLLSI